jgi:peptide-methionine (S)-S-oxide reductase
MPIACWHAGKDLNSHSSSSILTRACKLQVKVAEMKMNNEMVVLDVNLPLVGSCDGSLQVVEVLDLVASLQVAVEADMKMNDEIVVLLDANSSLAGSRDAGDVSLEIVKVLDLESLQVAVVEMNMNDEIVVLDANSPLVGSSSACDLTLEVVDVLNLESLQVEDMKMNDEIVVLLDTNSSLAGTCDADNVTLEIVEEVPSWKFEYHNSETSHLSNDKYEVCTFALGCFWAAELAFQRVPGVVGTTAGYSQGFTINPTYDQVCTGTTHHREAVQVVFDTTVTSFPVLLQTALERLAVTAQPSSSSSSLVGASQLFDTEEEQLSPSKQYHHGVFYHTDEQRLAVEETIGLDHNIYEIELLPAKTFYTAEDSHQKYLMKGGQCARKGANEPIMCY